MVRFFAPQKTSRGTAYEDVKSADAKAEGYARVPDLNNESVGDK